jgi:hypothetical protein
MLKSYIRYVRSKIFPRINVEKLISPYEAIGEKKDVPYLHRRYSNIHVI